MDYIRFILLFIILSVGKGVMANPRVETEPSVTLREGSEANLTCGYEREAFAIYWRKNVTTLSTSSTEILVYLDLYYDVGKRKGPGLDDGYNVSDDFALVIHEVRQKDAGMFICEVSDLEEDVLYRNYTIVNIQGTGVTVSPHVETEPSVTVREGSEAILPCGYERVVSSVYWYKNVTNSTTSSQELLIYFDLFYNEGERSGPGLDDGYNITDSFALVINEVHQKDAGMFICEVSDFVEGVVYRNHTIVNIQGNEQSKTSKGVSSGITFAIALCVIVSLVIIVMSLLILGHRKNMLPSRVSEMIQNIPFIKKVDVASNIEKMDPDVEEDERGQGDEEQSEIIQNRPSIEIKDTASSISKADSEVVEDESQEDEDNSECTKLLTKRENQEEPDNLKKKRKHLRDKIQSYNIGEAARNQIPENRKNVRPNIALFGLTAAGKSTFINALLYSVTGEYRVHCQTRDKTSEGAKTLYRNKIESKMLNFGLIDNRGIRDLSTDSIKDFISEIRGERGTDPKTKIEKNEDEQSHCPVLVLNVMRLDVIANGPSNMKAWDNFIKKFSHEMKKYFGQCPMLALTHKDTLVDMTKLEQLKIRIQNLNIPPENIWAFENYTKERHQEDVNKDIELLEFTWKALEMCDRNMAHIAR